MNVGVDLLNVTAASVTHICQFCGQGYEPKRSDSKTCSQNCRKGMSRRKDQIKRAGNIAVQQIAFIKRYMRQYDDLEIVGGMELDRIVSSVTLAAVTHK